MIRKEVEISKTEDKFGLESFIYSIIDSIPTALLITGLDNTVLLFNNPFIQLWQIPDESVKLNKRKNIFTFLDSRIEEECFFTKTNEHLKENQFDAIFKEVTHKNGSIIECYTAPRWTKNELNGRIWSFRDITQQKKAEELLISQKKELNRAHSIALLGSWTYNLQTKEFKRSESFFNMCEGLLFQKTIDGILSVVHSEDVGSVKNFFKEITSRQSIDNKECRYRIVNKNGDEYYIKTIVELQNNPNSPQLIWGITQDVTQQTLLEKSLASAKEAAEDYTIAKDNILSNISHEMRTPLNAILGYTNILIENSTDEFQRNYFYSIKSSGESLLSLIDDIINISKPEKGNVDIKEDKVDIRKLVSELHQIFEHEFRKKGVGFSIEVNKEIPDYIIIDESRIKQILNSLINNSLKFTETGSVSVRFEGETTIYNDIFNLSIYVEDTGIGIAEKNQNKIFDSFQQIENSPKRNYEGIGLGLFITKRNVDLLGGIIKLHSVLNKGSVFIINFKNIKTYSGTRKYLLKEHLKAESLKFEKASILVADDHEFNKEILRHILSRFNFEIIEVGNGNDAVLLAGKFSPSLIILDLKMPGMDGYSTLEKLKENSGTANIPVIAFSSREKGINKEDLRNQGFSDFLSKPVTSTKTINVLCRFLDYKQLDSSKQSPLFNEAVKVFQDEMKRDLLTKELLGSWEKLSLKKTLKEQLEFAQKLVRFGQMNNIAFFVEQGELLNQNLKVYDIEKSGEILGLVSQFFQKIKTKL
jgi:signal transduction histidine kinase/DNA-binding NarL/FixJ family response regulator